jgi:hypothetical protein
MSLGRGEERMPPVRRCGAHDAHRRQATGAPGSKAGVRAVSRCVRRCMGASE